MKTLAVISQVYAPDPAAVGQYVADVAEEAARRGWRVVVYTSARGYDDPSVCYPRSERRNGVDVRRLPLSSFGKRSIAVRLAAQSLFMLQAIIRAVFLPGMAAVLVSTSPPFAGFGGAVVSWLRRVPLTWWVMDLNPDQMIASGRLPADSPAARGFDWLNRVTIARASTIVALDRFMRDRVVAKAASPAAAAAKTVVIPPWSLDTHLRCDQAETVAFRTRHGLHDRFVVMYAGNHSEQNPLDTLLDAAERVRDLDRLAFVFVGGGAGKTKVDRAVADGAPNILSLPYQPLDDLAAALSAADLHVVSVGDSLVGIVHPCKIYSAMAVGRPILLFGPAACPAAEILEQADVGWWVRHGDVARAACVLREACDAPTERLDALGQRSAAWIGRHFSRRALLDSFLAIVLRDRPPRDAPCRTAVAADSR